MNVVDSSAWLEYFVDGPNASIFREPILDTPNLIAPTIVLYEVFKVIRRERDEEKAVEGIVQIMRGKVIDFNLSLAISAATLSADHKLPLADSIILATARGFHATLWTQDHHFEGLPGVKYFKKVQN